MTRDCVPPGAKRHAPVISFAVLLPTLLLIVLGASAMAQSEQYPSGTEIDTSEAIAIADSQFVVIDADGHAEIRHHRIVRVNSSEGAKYAVLSVIENSFSKLSSVHGRQFDAAGNVLDSVQDKKALAKVCGFGPSFSLYVDACTFYGSFRTARVPYTVEWESQTKLSSVGMWPGWMPDPTLFLQSGYCEIKADPTNKFKYLPIGPVTTENPEITTKGITRRWTVTNQPALDLELAEPWPGERTARVYACAQSFNFAGTEFDATSWNTLSRSIYEMSATAFKSGSAHDDFLKRISKGSPDSLFTALHRALSEKLRYVAIYFGMNGWVPHSAKETFDLGYGDCKDLATLYSVLYAKAGVQTRNVLIATRNSEVIKPEIRQISLFNHVIMICLSGNDTVWVDPTCFDCALGDLPYSDEGVNVLIQDPINGNLVTTPSSNCGDNLVHRNFHIEIDADLSAQFTLRSSLKGNAAHGMHELIKSGDPGRTVEYLASLLNLSGLPTVDQKDISINRHEHSLLEIAMSWNKPRFLKKSSDLLIFDLSDVRILSNIEMLDLSTRKHALEIGYPRTLIDTIRLAAPAGFAWKTLPDSVIYDSDFGDLRVLSTFEADTAVITRSLSRKRNIIEPEQFESYQAFRKEITARGRAVATLVKK